MRRIIAAAGARLAALIKLMGRRYAHAFRLDYAWIYERQI